MQIKLMINIRFIKICYTIRLIACFLSFVVISWRVGNERCDISSDLKNNAFGEIFALVAYSTDRYGCKRNWLPLKHLNYIVYQKK